MVGLHRAFALGLAAPGEEICCTRARHAHLAQQCFPFRAPCGMVMFAIHSLLRACVVCVNVTSGIGGDCFCLFYEAKTGKVHGMNASGRTPAALCTDVLREQGVVGDFMSHTSPHSISVPGAAAGWCDAAERFGTMPLKDLLAPAIQLAEEGFPVHEVAAAGWAGAWDRNGCRALTETCARELATPALPFV